MSDGISWAAVLWTSLGAAAAYLAYVVVLTVRMEIKSASLLSKPTENEKPGRA